MQVKKEVNDGKIEPKMNEKPNKSPQKGLKLD
jgi:hypothetical protein